MIADYVIITVPSKWALAHFIRTIRSFTFLQQEIILAVVQQSEVTDRKQSALYLVTTLAVRKLFSALLLHAVIAKCIVTLLSQILGMPGFVKIERTVFQPA